MFQATRQAESGVDEKEQTHLLQGSMIKKILCL